MGHLKERFGSLLAAHRKRLGWTQHKLAEFADLSEDTVRRIELGKRGVNFSTIERLATVLQIDPAELFTSELESGSLHRSPLSDLTARLARLKPDDIEWVSGIVEAALRPKR